MRNAILRGLVPAALVPGLLLLFPKTIWPAVIAYHLYCFFTFGPKWKTLDIRKSRLPKWSLWAAGISGLTLAPIFFAEHLPYQDGLMVADLQAIMFPWGLFVGYSVIVNPLIEESFWREGVQEKCGLFWSAVLFGLMHVGALFVMLPPVPAAILSAGAFALGFLWGWFRRRFGTLWPCIIMHTAVDVALVSTLARLSQHYGV